MRILYSLLLCCLVQSAQGQCNATITPLGPTTFCQGGSVYLVASQGDIFQWHESGIPISGATNDTFYAHNSGNYTVIVDSAGCIDTSAVLTVVENTPLPAPGPIVGPDTICNGSIQTYSTTVVPGALGYIWSGISSSGLTDTTILPTITGPVAPSQSAPQTTIYVRAFDGCLGDPVTKVVIDMAPPQIDGHWPFQRDVADMMLRICPGTSYTLFPVMHGAPGIVHTDPYTFQWYLNNVPITGATDWEHVITRGGNYSVKISTHYCGATFTVPKKVYQDLPNSITVSPSGPLSFCTGNVAPLTVSFDMTGVSDPIKWYWMRAPSHYEGANTYSLLPDTSGYYAVFVQSTHLFSNCAMSIPGNAVEVVVPPVLEITQSNDTLFATPGYNSYQWYESNVALSGATSQTHVLTYDGIYFVEATYMNGCVEASDTLDPNYMPGPPDPSNEGEQEEFNEKGIITYPNPMAASFTLLAKVPLEDKTADITITDMMGHVLFSKSVEAKDGLVEENIEMEENSTNICVLKVRSKGSNKTISLLKK